MGESASSLLGHVLHFVNSRDCETPNSWKHNIFVCNFGGHVLCGSWLCEEEMMELDERLPVLTYLRRSLTSVDGVAWGALLAMSIVCGADLLFRTNLIPLRGVANPAKAAVLLAFSPLITFLVMVALRQVPFSALNVSAWIRAAALAVIFLILNF